jgi:hypothetical protein
MMKAQRIYIDVYFKCHAVKKHISDYLDQSERPSLGMKCTSMIIIDGVDMI